MAIKPAWFDPQMLVETTLQGYRLERFLGSGGFGSVYYTTDTRGDARAAKVLYPPHSLGNEDMAAWSFRANNFRREALTAARFHHPNIVRVFDTLQTNWPYHDPLGTLPGHLDLSGDYPLHVYVAEYIPDGVDQRFKDGGLFSSDEAINIGVQICEALAALHSASPRVLHRDLNPGNIRLAEAGRVVVTDFGVARIEGLPTAYVDQEGPIFHRGVGAPEQFAGETADVRTDIYQLGALLLVMLTGQYPNQGGVRSLQNRQDVPQRFTQAILRCLQTGREERFQSVADLKDALETAFLLPRHLPRSWEFSLKLPNWRTWSTPVSDSAEGCYIWDRHTLHRLDPDTGTTTWSWTPGQDGPRAGIRDGPQSPAVQVGGQLLFVRHGNFLSCLRPSDGAPQWDYQHWSDITGNFLLANGLVVLDSYRAQGRGLFGPAALSADSGLLAWHSEEPYYHVVSMAATDTALVLVEGRGIGGLGGSRVRLLDLSRGETLVVHDLFRPGDSERAGSGEYVSGVSRGRLMPVNSEAGAFRPRRPVIMAGDSIVVWSDNGISPRLQAFCFDRQLKLRWTKLIEAGNTPSDQASAGSNFLVGAGEDLLAFGADYGNDRRAQQGWVTEVDLQTGELGQTSSLPDNSIPLSAVGVPDGSAAFLAALPGDGDDRSASRWRLVAFSPDSGEMSYLGPEGESLDGLMPLAPVATSSHLYLQIPLARSRGWARAAGGPAPASIAAFHWP